VSVDANYLVNVDIPKWIEQKLLPEFQKAKYAKYNSDFNDEELND